MPVANIESTWESGNLVFKQKESGGSALIKFDGVEIIKTAKTAEQKIYVDPNGDDTNGTGTIVSPYATITKAMSLVTTTRKTIICMPGTYTEDVTWSDVNGVKLLALIPGTVTVEAVTAFAISIDPAAASSTWSATIGVGLSHGDGLVGLQVDNSTVGKRINLFLLNVDIESETATDHAIDVNRSGSASDAIRIYANGQGNTIEGLVHFITESTDDRVRFWGYRLVGGFECSGAIVNELTFVCCGIKTSGLTVATENVYNTIACYNETDANPNVHTAVADAVEQ